MKSLPDDPKASAYHDITKKGQPFAICAVSTCVDLYGPNGVSVDASHEILEAAGDQGANAFANDDKGLLHAFEMCDAVEVQTYGKTCKDGTVVQVSNWLLRAWFIPGAPAPYEYMSFAKLPGAVPPAGPLQTAKGSGGNYQIVCKAATESQITAALHHQDHGIEGHRKKGPPNPASRAGYRLAQLNGTLKAK